MNYTYKIYGLLTVMPFGKYKGHTIQDIADQDMSYMNWLYTTVITVSPQVRLYMLLKHEPNITQALLDPIAFPLPLN